MEYTTNYQLRKPIIGVDEADIKDLNRNMDTIDAIMNASQNSLAPAYDTSEEYNTGDVVMYEMLMYECLEDEVTGVWDATKWQRTTAGQHGGGGGSDVSITPILQSGTKIAEYEIDGVQGELYAPTGGGGGGGNLSDLGDVNISSPTDGQALVYDATNQEWINGAGGGGSNVYGAFIDTNREIQAQTTIPSNSTVTYTATEDCALIYNLACKNGSEFEISIDDVKVTRLSQWISSEHIRQTNVLYVRKGQVVTMTQMTNNWSYSNYTVYGLTFGTNNIFTPQIYSLEEREVGVWTDGKTLYQKTIHIASIPSESYDYFDIANDIDRVVNVQGMVNGITPIYMNRPDSVTAEFSVQIAEQSGEKKLFFRSHRSATGYADITCWYTKTTDTAGSGSWTPSGVPAHHYSEDEQPMGTFLGETYYERVYEFNTPIQISMESWTDVNDYIPNIGFGKIIEAKGIDANGTLQGTLLCGKNASNHIQLQSPRNGSANIAVSYIILQYTKSS